MTVKERLAQLIEALPEEDAEDLLESLEAQRQEKVKAVRGSAAHVPGSVEDFLQRKQKEIDREEKQAARRQQAAI
jgi:hypothetical protein